MVFMFFFSFLRSFGTFHSLEYACALCQKGGISFGRNLHDGIQAAMMGCWRCWGKGKTKLHLLTVPWFLGACRLSRARATSSQTVRDLFSTIPYLLALPMAYGHLIWLKKTSCSCASFGFLCFTLWKNHPKCTAKRFTLWLFNIAMENGPFIDGLPGFTY